MRNSLLAVVVFNLPSRYVKIEKKKKKRLRMRLKSLCL